MKIEIDGVETKAVDAALQPEAGNGKQRLLHSRVMKIEVRLLGQEVVQVILLAPCIPLPCRAAEDRKPVVGRGAVGLRVGPHIPVRPGVVAAGAAFPEPRVDVGGMRQHGVDHDLEAEPVRFRDQRVEILEGSEHRVHVAIVADVVAEILHRRFEERRYPDGVHAKIRDVAHAADDTLEIAHPVAVRILEAAWIDLVDDRAPPPVGVDDCGGCLKGIVGMHG